MLFSGVYFNLPKQVNVIVKQFSPITRINAFSTLSQDDFSSIAQKGQSTISMAKAEAIVEKQYPSGRLWMFFPPKEKTGVYKIMKRDVWELSQFVGYRNFIIDQYSGKILKIYESGTGSAGDVFLDWQWPLHSGFAFGWPGRILVFLAGLACPVLYVTGVIRWLQKRKAKKSRKIKQRKMTIT